MKGLGACGGREPQAASAAEGTRSMGRKPWSLSAAACGVREYGAPGAPGPGVWPGGGSGSQWQWARIRKGPGAEGPRTCWPPGPGREPGAEGLWGGPGREYGGKGGRGGPERKPEGAWGCKGARLGPGGRSLGRKGAWGGSLPEGSLGRKGVCREGRAGAEGSLRLRRKGSGKGACQWGGSGRRRCEPECGEVLHGACSEPGGRCCVPTPKYTCEPAARILIQGRPRGGSLNNRNGRKLPVPRTAGWTCPPSLAARR